MSAMPNHYEGKLRLMPRLENETLEEQCKRILTDKSTFLDYSIEAIKAECEECYDGNYENMMRDVYTIRNMRILDGNYMFIDDNIYKVINVRKRRDYLSDIYDSKVNKDGTIDYEIRYYDWSYKDEGKDFENAIIKAIKNKENNYNYEN